MEYRLTTNTKGLLLECFSTDKDFMSFGYNEPMDLNSFIERTYKEYIDNQVDIYELISDNKVCGYFGIEAYDFMTGFFLKPEFRNKEHIIKFWNTIDSAFQDYSYYAGIYKNNTRAYNFLSKRGRVWLEIDKGYFFILNERVA